MFRQFISTLDVAHIVQNIKYELFGCKYLKMRDNKIQMKNFLSILVNLFNIFIFRSNLKLVKNMLKFNFLLLNNKTSLDENQLLITISEMNIQNIERPFASNYATNTSPFLNQKNCWKGQGHLSWWGGAIISLISINESFSWNFRILLMFI